VRNPVGGVSDERTEEAGVSALTAPGYVWFETFFIAHSAAATISRQRIEVVDVLLVLIFVEVAKY